MTTDVRRIRERVASFPRWHYEFDLNGVRTPIAEPAFANRHQERRRYLFEPLVRLFGGSLAGKRVLDLGCNAGFWSLLAIEAGADYVLGVDGRQMYIDQASLVFEVKGIQRNRYRFVAADLFDLELTDEEPFEVVLCLGLLYHVSKPVSLFERIAAWNTDVLVIDTTLSRAPGAYFQIHGEGLEKPLTAVDHGIALTPTRQAVASLAHEFGYSVAMLRPRFASWEGSRDYWAGFRRAFVCAKQTPLEGLDTEAVTAKPLDVPAWAGDALLRRIRG